MRYSDHREACRAVCDEAKARLTLVDLWHLAPWAAQVPAPRRDGLCRSPFREDKNPSFGVTEGLKVWCDHATGQKGGVWEFLKLCLPGIENRDIARKLVELAGLEWPKLQRFTPSEDPEASPMTDAALLREKRLAAKQKKEEALDRIYREREKELLTIPQDARKVEPLSRDMEGIWHEGRQVGPELMEALAAKRGWPVEWVEGLHLGGLVSWPCVPWRKTTRSPAFAVQDAKGTLIGWHQCLKYATPADEDQKADLDWLFLPYIPKRPPRTQVERILASEQKRIPPLPFWIGDPSAPMVIVTEGQWDAVSVWGALGGFNDSFDASVLVLGVRGSNSGTDMLLSAWGLKLSGKRIWVLCDNDDAGRRWVRPEWRNHCQPAPISFVDRLRRASGIAPVVSLLKDKKGMAKDFNDYWREARPSPAVMWRWIDKLGLLGGAS